MRQNRQQPQAKIIPRYKVRSSQLRSLRGAPNYRRLQVEPLEDRRLLATVTVNTELDTVDFNDNVTSLREAIFATNLVAGPDTINFDFGHDGPATIVLTQGELAITDKLAIDGPGAELLTIDASGNDPTPDLNNGDGSRVFNVDDGQASSRIEVTITGLRLIGGDVAADGGAILSREDLTVANSVVEGNTAVASSPAGGGIYSAAPLVIENSRILDNIADGRSTRGGGVAAFDGLTIRNSEISGNRGGVGGVYSRSLTSGTSVVDSTISGNSGGGLVISNNTGRPVEIVGTTIADNTSGMGLRITARNGASVLISESTISGHTDGGGLRLSLYSGSTATIRDSDFIGNVSDVNNGGGASIGAANGSVTIDRCNFIENTAPGGGGLFAVGNVQVSNSVFRGNVANGSFQATGGGILIGGESGATSQVAIRNSLIEANSTSSTGLNRGHGGGIFSRLRFDLVESTVTGNSATGSGGGIYARVAGSTILRSNVRGNSAGEDGGGIAAKAGSRSVGLSVTDSSIGTNTAGRDGGGLFADSAAVVIAGSTIHENSAGRNGGGLRLHVDSSITNSTLSGNRTGGSGGGIWAISNTTIEHSTITENEAVVAGGGAFANFGSLALSHTIVASNTAPPGPDLHRGPNGPITADYSLIGDGEDSGLPSGSIETPDANGNLIGGGNFERINPMLGPLADNGGPTLTHALLPGSPAINAGNLNAKPGIDGVPQFDQRGEPFARIASGRIDIGAFELQEKSDLNLLVDTLSDELDDNHGRGDLSLREAIELANMWPSIDAIRFDPALISSGPATILLTRGELKITDQLTIEGPGAELLTIDASGNDPTPELNNGDGSRIFAISVRQGEDSSGAHISGLTLTGGDIRDVGGAIRTTSTLTIEETAIVGNHAMGDGGGVAILGPTGALTVIDCTVSGNFARRGAAISSNGGNTTIQAGQFIKNTASDAGGAVFFFRSQAAGDLNVFGAMFMRNSVLNESSVGAAIYAVDFPEPTPTGINALVITGNTFRENTARHGGAGVFARMTRGTVHISDNELVGNVASNLNSRGGGIFLLALTATVEFIGNTLRENSAGRGGAIYVTSQTADNTPATILIDDNLIISNTANFGESEGGGIAITGQNVAVTVRNSTIVGNRAVGAFGRGGGIFMLGGPLSVESSTVSGNSASRFGGGIYTRSGLTIVDTTITGNVAQQGGGIDARSESQLLDISGSNFSSNKAIGEMGHGGAIHHQAGRLTVTDSRFSENSANGSGGGIYSAANQEVRIAQSQFVGNSAEVDGGGMASVGSAGRGTSLNALENTFTQNRAGRNGGGLLVSGRNGLVASTLFDSNEAEHNGGAIGVPGGPFTLINSTLSNNSAGVFGGGIWISTAATVSHATIYQNDAMEAGGGTFLTAGTLNLSNSIVARNVAPSGADVSGFLGTTLNPRFSLIGTNVGTGLSQSPAGTPDANGNLIGSGAGIDPRLGPLTHNGGPTRTHALLPESPAIDAGDPAARPGIDGVPLNDQRAAPFTRVYGGRIDIGAFERQPTDFLLGDFNRSGTVDAADLILWRKANSMTDGMGIVVDSRGNGDGIVDEWDYALWRANFGLRMSDASAAVAEERLTQDLVETNDSTAIPIVTPSPITNISRGSPELRSRFQNASFEAHDSALTALLDEQEILAQRGLQNSSPTITKIQFATESPEAIDHVIEFVVVGPAASDGTSLAGLLADNPSR